MYIHIYYLFIYLCIYVCRNKYRCLDVKIYTYTDRSMDIDTGGAPMRVPPPPYLDHLQIYL